MELLCVVFSGCSYCYNKLFFEDRLENEHLGNVDQYRVTREVPLPYSLDDIGHDIDDDEDTQD